jgi:hypothetical protein
MFECPVCLFAGLARPPYAVWPPPEGLAITPPYIEWLGKASYEVCPMCEYEFGFDDNPGVDEGASFEEYRAEWESRSSPVAHPTEVAQINATRERK